MLKKEIKEKFDKKYYLLGKRKEDGAKVWLEEGHFDCNWYWGFGYVEIFNHNYTDIDEHNHFDSLFFKGVPDKWYDYFEDSVLNGEEVWRILELMKVLYTARNYSDMLHRKGSNISTQQDIADIISNDEEYDRINNEVIPELLSKVYELLS